jgi:hypothetical protein
MLRTIFLAAVALSGCAGARLMPAGVAGNEAFVSVSNVWGAGDALPYAEKHCAKFGKIAKLNRTEGYSVSFDCIAPTSPPSPFR